MIFEQTLFPLLASAGCSVFLTHGIVRWRNAKSRTSIFAQDSNPEEVGFSALSSLFSRAPIDLGHGKTELRPTWGIRLLAPLVALVFLIFMDFSEFWRSLGLESTTSQFAVYVGFGLVLGYSWFMMLFVQRIVYDDHYIVCHGVDLRPQSRRLSDLVDIRVHEKRPALVLSFSEQPTLYVPKFVSHRETFIRDMEEISANNINNGAVHPLPRWQEHIGF